jgi:hypothetical protein
VKTPDSQVEIEATCEVHHGSGRLVIRREDRMVLDARADHYCVITVSIRPHLVRVIPR